MTVYCLNCRADVTEPHECPTVDAWHRVHLPNIEHLGPATYKGIRRPIRKPAVDKPHSWRIW